MSTVYRVKGWDEWFESAKSKGYKFKSQTYTPNKHGLGYRMLIRNGGDRIRGAALFGAWRAMTDVLSRQAAPRQGYCTDTGMPDGIPLVSSMLEALTDIPAAIFDEMMKVASSEVVGWLEAVNPKDTTGAVQGHCKDTTGVSKSSYEGECKGKGEGECIPEGGTGGRMPADGWSLSSVLAESNNPTVAVPEKTAREYYDARTAAGWVDATKRDVARSLEALRSDLRKWKAGEDRRATGPAQGKPQGGSESAHALNLRIEAAKAELDRLPTDSHNRTAEQKARANDLHGRIREWRKQLAGG
jgi:hypothetical protein